MSAEIIPFDFEMQAVRVVIGDDGQPWFVAKDVCDALGIKNSRDALDRLENDEKGVGNTDTLGGTQELSTVNESGLYALIFRSRKPQAKRFRKWVTAEVLPSIRQHGRYEMPAESLGDMPPIGQADRLINAERVFRSVTRLQAAVAKSSPQAMAIANAATQAATGIDLMGILTASGWQPSNSQQAALGENPFTDKLAAWLEENAGTAYATEQLMTEALDISEPDYTDYMLLSQAMQSLGWENAIVRNDNRDRRRGYRKPRR